MLGARILAASVLASALGCSPLVRAIGGAWKHAPADTMAPGSARLVEQAFEGFSADAPPHDYHTHIVGLGDGGNEPWVHPDLLDSFKGRVYLSAAGVGETSQARTANARYEDRLLALVEGFPVAPVQHVLAFDYHRNCRGAVVRANSDFATPDAYVQALVGRHPEHALVAVGSVHPHDPQATQRLAQLAAADPPVHMIKWLPNAMGIDAAECSERMRDYYRALREHDLVLLTHVGWEKAVEAKERQRLGDPLRFELALAMGVKVVMAHGAGLGCSEGIPNFERFLALMDRPEYEDRLFGEISAMTQANRLHAPPRRKDCPDRARDHEALTGAPLAELLRRPRLWSRLVNGSDYPLPAVNVLVRTRALVRAGLIDRSEREDLARIYDYNPLLFDFVLKRRARILDDTGQAIRLPVQVFQRHPDLPGARVEPLPDRVAELCPRWSTEPAT